MKQAWTCCFVNWHFVVLWNTKTLSKWFHIVMKHMFKMICQVIQYNSDKFKLDYNFITWYAMCKIIISQQMQGCNWLPKTGWASSNVARCRWPAAPSILPKTGWAVDHPSTRHLHPWNVNGRCLILFKYDGSRKV